MVECGAAFAGMIADWYGGWTPGTKVLVTLLALGYILGCAHALTGKSNKTETGHFLS